MSEKKQLNPIWAAAKPFVNGGASGMISTCIIQPIDMVKVRIQLGEKGNPVSARQPLLRGRAWGGRRGEGPAGWARPACHRSR